METTQPAENPVPPTPGEPGSGGPAGWPRVRVSSPGDVLAVVPHILGFHPQRSFVVLGASATREHVELGFRYDLPDPPDAGAARQIAAHAVAILARHDISTVIGVGYGPGRLVTPVADLLAATLRGHRLRLRELMRVEDGRYWSYLCRDVSCCPAEGVPFDYESHPAAAAMAAAGLGAYPTRAARASVVAPLTGDAAAAMGEAIERARERAAALVGGASAPGSTGGLHLLISQGRRSVRAAIRTYRGGGRVTDADRLAWLMVALANLPVRDDAWARMEPEHRAAHLALWSDVVRHASGPWLPAPASLLAFTAWQSGDGTLANIALERALAADPGYSMALLLRDILESGVPPSAARLPMTPRQVAASYRRRGQPPGPGPARPARSRRGRGGGSRRGARGSSGGQASGPAGPG